ncbi:hypothetical protein GCM10022214_74300 [Actinomadura miaoliensis]|uniref:Uncharacterized protein n=1 Tax=Actinomadura miaoliensis TaxID=430685 RepID=A0ABP7WZ04_9ACTN
MPTNETEARPPGQGAGLPKDAHGSDVTTSIRRYPAVYASLYAPAGRRRMWWLTLRCPHCRAGHFGRVPSEAAAGGVRRTPCGRRVWVVVARVYRPEGAQ